jgi:hypothetical protein
MNCFMNNSLDYPGIAESEADQYVMTESSPCKKRKGHPLRQGKIFLFFSIESDR